MAGDGFSGKRRERQVEIMTWGVGAVVVAVAGGKLSSSARS
jgi:hypothetical protein